ncbi:adenylosuccinate synthetase [Paenibacillus cellulosilyticus]|uniref:Adenylosuccinate synthetase n=1 Tax=Paenibacillus cellulosilyticus TaxID=375489 RepID=A0A2V2YU38_9BACL|nr:adenylosuccinate synthase [Paenibacillus cellulosilyticus]PWW03137.1 adenylosuccinate synthetase [Paenibacillus cellulosilyticus]QKS43638.1 adenylosuccinate synthase [Paenibacillus cellulosilyticus]
MSVTAVVGANWGDEGKGKITDLLAEQYRCIVRYQGGSNAGHTIINAYGKFALHLLPSGVFTPGTLNIIGPGVAFNPEDFLREYDNLLSRGIPAPDIHISDRAQLVLPYHIELDTREEERLGAQSFGSTRSGIAPFYADKALKIGIPLSTLFGDEAQLRCRIQSASEAKNTLLQHLYHAAPIDSNQIADRLLALKSRLAPFITNTTILLHDSLAAGGSILVEGQLGALRDPDHGIFPYVTSSSTIAGYAAIGAGVPPHAINRIIAVTKAYSSCVGAGPFVTELTGDAAEHLRRLGGDAGEYGVKTGRPRRVGWFDAVATRYGCMVQGATEVALTNLDVLGYLDEIPVCTGYRLNGQVTTDFLTADQLALAEPVLDTLPGWRCDISHIRSFDQLPLQVQQYVQWIEQIIGVPIRIVSVGPDREQTIYR